MSRLFLDRKADRFKFCKFTCDKCATPQSVLVAVGNKTCTCIACDRKHAVQRGELHDKP